MQSNVRQNKLDYCYFQLTVTFFLTDPQPPLIPTETQQSKNNPLDSPRLHSIAPYFALIIIFRDNDTFKGQIENEKKMFIYIILVSDYIFLVQIF